MHEKQKQKIVEVIQVCYELNKENKSREIKELLEAKNKHKLTQSLPRKQTKKIKQTTKQKK